jgi:MFS family permease
VPIFITTVLGAPMAALGLIEGLAESAANILKIFSRWWSDLAGKRRPFVIGGYSLGSYPAGMLADRIGSRIVYSLGLLLFSLVYLGFAFNHSPAAVWVLFAVYGFYTAFTDGVGKAYASKLAPAEQRATGMGIYHMSNGLATFAASTVAGLLWQAFGFKAAFIYGSMASLLAVGTFVFLIKSEK